MFVCVFVCVCVCVCWDGDRVSWHIVGNLLREKEGQALSKKELCVGWSTMEHNVKQWNVMGPNGMYWKIMERDGTQWNMMGHDGTQPGCQKHEGTKGGKAELCIAAGFV